MMMITISIFVTNIIIIIVIIIVIIIIIIIYLLIYLVFVIFLPAVSDHKEYTHMEGGAVMAMKWRWCCLFWCWIHVQMPGTDFQRLVSGEQRLPD